MIPSRMIAIARQQTGKTPTGIVSAAEAFEHLNIILSDFWDDISGQDTGYGDNTWTYDITANTAKYTLATPVAAALLADSTFGISSISKIGIKYNSGDSDYTPVKLIYLQGMLELPDTYTSDATKSSPIALITDTSITIYPTPTASVTDGLRVIGPKEHFTLSATTEDVAGCVLIPAKRHRVIVKGLKIWFYGARGADFESLETKAQAEYDKSKLKAINQLAQRGQESPEAFVPDLSSLG